MSGVPYTIMIALAAWWLGALVAPRLGRAERWALGGVLALGALSAAAFLQRLLLDSLPGPLTQLSLLAILTLGLWALRRRAMPSETPPAPPSGDSSPALRDTSPSSETPSRNDAAPPSRAWLRGARLGWFAALALALLSAGDWSQAEPAGDWDGMAIWTMNARQLARVDEDRAASMALRQRGHPGYPLFVSGNIALAWQWHDDESQGAPRALAVLLVALLAAASLGGFTRHAGELLGTLASATLLATPALSAAARMQAADVALALVGLLAALRLVATLADSTQRPTAPAWCTGYLLGLLPWVKNEGLVLMGCLLLAGIGPILRSAWSRRGAAFGALVGLAVSLGVLISFKRAWAPSDRMINQLRPALRRFLPDPERWRTAAGGFAEELLPLGPSGTWLDRWALLSMLLPLALLLTLRARRTPLERLVPRALLLWFACLLGIYTLTIADQRWHMDTSLWRLCLAVLPLGLWATLPSRPGGSSRAPRSLS